MSELVTPPLTYPAMNAQIVGMLRRANHTSQYAAQRIVELEAENNRLRAEEKTEVIDE